MSIASTARVGAIAPAAVPPASARWALARVEARRLVTHPLFVFGMATSVAALALADSDVSERSTMLSGDCFVVLGGAIWTFIVTFLAASRADRDAAHDFYAVAPVRSRVRIEAALVSVGFAGLAGAALIAIATLILAGVDGTVVIDAQPQPGQSLPPRSHELQALELAQGPGYLVTAGTLGVLVGSRTRHVFAGVFAALVLFLPPLALLPRFVFDHGMSAGFYGSVQVGAPFEWRIAAWHLIAMVGLVTLAAAGALMRDGRSTRIALLLIGATATAAVVALGPRPGG